MPVVRWRYARLVLFATLCGWIGSAAAQQPPAAPAAPAAAASSLNILVVDVQALLQNSKSAKMVRQQLEQKRIEYQKEMSHEEEALKKERDSIQRQQPSLSQEALGQKTREFQQKLNDFDHNMQVKRQILEKANAEAGEKIQEAMLKIITDIAKERKANLVFQRSELVLFDQQFDVTDEVLQKLDEQLPTLTVNFVAPAATGNGSAPAAAATQPASAAQPAAAAPAKTPLPAQKKKQ